MVNPEDKQVHQPWTTRDSERSLAMKRESLREIDWPKLASTLAPRRDAWRAPHGCDGGCSLTHFAFLHTHLRSKTCACVHERPKKTCALRD